MVYEARWSRPVHFVLAAAVLALSALGFAAAGVIPTASGANPPVGWAIVAACFLAAFIFMRRAMDRNAQARIDASGVHTRRTGLVPWSEIGGLYAMRAGIQRIARFARAGGRDFGINTTFYDRGIADLLAAVRHHRPDLIA